MSEPVPLGKLIEGEAERDAVHVAIAPVVAIEKLSPGQPIGFVGECREQVAFLKTKHIGVVDPFLKWPVLPGERFFMLLFPNSVTGMRHHWAHPEFAALLDGKDAKPTPEDVKLTLARKTIELTANICGLSYEKLIQEAKYFVNDGECIHMGTNEDYKGVENWGDFWDAFEIITGMKAREGKRWGIFTCSC